MLQVPSTTMPRLYLVRLRKWSSARQFLLPTRGLHLQNEEFTHTTVRIWSLAATAVTNIYTRRVILLLIICYTDGLCLLVQGKVWAKLMVFNWCGEPSRRCEKKMVRYRLKTFVIIALRRALCILFLFQFNNKYYKL